MALKFKIGDRVYIKSLNATGFDDPDVKMFLGKVGKIYSIDPNCTDNLKYRVKFRKNVQYFVEEELVLYTKGSRQTLQVLYGKS